MSLFGIGEAIQAVNNQIMQDKGFLYNAWADRTAYRRNLSAMRQQNAMNVYNAQHAHQWEVEDLRKAGLNPILSASGGSGVSVPAASPAGAHATPGPAGSPTDFAGMFQRGAAAKLLSEQQKSEVEKQKMYQEQAKVYKATAAKEEEQAWSLAYNNVPSRILADYYMTHEGTLMLHNKVRKQGFSSLGPLIDFGNAAMNLFGK